MSGWADAPWRPVPSGASVTVTEVGRVHVVAEVREWSNPHGAVFTDWLASCGVTGRSSGLFRVGGGTFGQAHTAPRRMLCADCRP